MRYPVISTSDARRYLAARREGAKVPVESIVRIKGEALELDKGFVEAMRAELGQIRSRFPGTPKKGGDDAAGFEAAASEAVHRLMPPCVEAVADRDFWLWLALAHFSDLVEWRYGNREGGVDWKNYGIGASGENLLYRLWLRGELGLDENARDRYDLARRGEIDFWRSHLFRQGYANTRTFARALIRFQYPDGNQVRPKLRIGAIRELVKRLRRLRANLVTEILDELAALRLIEAEAAALAQANASAST
jgi:hypothetical protein